MLLPPRRVLQCERHVLPDSAAPQQQRHRLLRPIPARHIHAERLCACADQVRQPRILRQIRRALIGAFRAQASRVLASERALRRGRILGAPAARLDKGAARRGYASERLLQPRLQRRERLAGLGGNLERGCIPARLGVPLERDEGGHQGARVGLAQRHELRQKRILRREQRQPSLKVDVEHTLVIRRPPLGSLGEGSPRHWCAGVVVDSRRAQAAPRCEQRVRCG
mmetsp:Transcript_6453/g.21579  ORF Transcript_6453/g.21579 Transcript_6453/m.21579 type:complete len:225 (+) Transcript_6453:1331-2005(+)